MQVSCSLSPTRSIKLCRCRWVMTVEKCCVWGGVFYTAYENTWLHIMVPWQIHLVHVSRGSGKVGRIVIGLLVQLVRCISSGCLAAGTLPHPLLCHTTYIYYIIPNNKPLYKNSPPHIPACNFVLLTLTN